jgi:hypothetical protein
MWVLHRLRNIARMSEGNIECLSIRSVAPMDTLFPGLGTSIHAIVLKKQDAVDMEKGEWSNAPSSPPSVY